MENAGADYLRYNPSTVLFANPSLPIEKIRVEIPTMLW
jgi:hypothetical protein